MARRQRYSEPDQVVEVTAKCIQGRFLLEGDRTLSRRFVGWWEKGRRRHDIRVHSLVVMSNHFHAQISGPSSAHISRFMNYVQGQVASEVNRCTGWRGKVWGDRYKSAPTLDDESCDCRLRYILSNSVKEGLVATPEDWPIVHCAKALLGDMSLPGEWVDRKRLRREGGKHESDYTVEMNLELTPLPHFEGMDDDARRAVIQEMVADIVAEHAPGMDRRAARHRNKRAMKKRARFHKPDHTKTTPAPRCHTVCPERRKAWEGSYRVFVAMYREASERLRASMGSLGYPPYSQVLAMALLE